MRSLASDVCKKGGLKRLRMHRDKDRCMPINCKMVERARITVKGKQTESRKQWKEHLEHREKEQPHETEGKLKWKREKPNRIKMKEKIPCM